jgi:hypothetical protein
VDSENAPCDHRICEPENGIGVRLNSNSAVIAGSKIAHHDGGGRMAGRRKRLDAAIVVGSLAVGDGDAERCPVVIEPKTSIPSLKLLFAVTLLSTPVTSAEPVGWTMIPSRELLEAIVFDTEKLLDVLGEILTALVKSRVTQFSIARVAPVLNWMPFVPVSSPSRARPRK